MVKGGSLADLGHSHEEEKRSVGGQGSGHA